MFVIGFKGEVESWKVKKNGVRYNYRKHPNLLVDDAIEYILDFVAGRKSWHEPSATVSGVGGLFSFTRYGGAGICMFNNASIEARTGKNGITGADFYPLTTTVLVSPEDSFLSNEVGSRVQVTAKRRDQTTHSAHDRQ